MNLDTAADEEIAKGIVEDGYACSAVRAIELAKRVMVRARAQANGLSPGDSGPSYGDAGLLAVDIVAKPDAYTTPMLALAKAYESQRERIADLEDDVERLRPINPFVSEVLFRDDDSDMDIETSSCGGIDIVQRDHEGRAIETTITNAQGKELASALSEWAGTGDGVQWREISDPPVHGVDVLMYGYGNYARGYMHGLGRCWAYGDSETPTHWAPLPKPPEAKS